MPDSKRSFFFIDVIDIVRFPTHQCRSAVAHQSVIAEPKMETVMDLSYMKTGIITHQLTESTLAL